jgi:hypothetical protein
MFTILPSLAENLRAKATDLRFDPGSIDNDPPCRLVQGTSREGRQHCAHRCEIIFAFFCAARQMISSKIASMGLAAAKATQAGELVG